VDAHPNTYELLIDFVVIPLGALALLVLGSMQAYLLWRYKKLSSLVFWESANKREYFVIKVAFLCFIASIIMGIILAVVSNTV
jgi:hypothetical protein